MAAVSAGSRKAGWSDSTSCRSRGNRTGDALVKMQVNGMPLELRHTRATSSKWTFRNGRYFEISMYDEAKESDSSFSSNEKKENRIADTRIIGNNNGLIRGISIRSGRSRVVSQTRINNYFAAGRVIDHIRGTDRGVIFSRRSKESKDSITGEVAGNNALCKQRSLDENAIACLSFFPLPSLSRYTLYIYIYIYIHVQIYRCLTKRGKFKFPPVYTPRNNLVSFLYGRTLKSWVKSIGGAREVGAFLGRVEQWKIVAAVEYRRIGRDAGSLETAPVFLPPFLEDTLTNSVTTGYRSQSPSSAA